MAEQAPQSSRSQATGLGPATRIGQWLRRAAGSDGHERRMVLLVVKSALAACVAWVISYEMLDAQSPAFAPFSAILMMQITVYQSVAQSLRYVGAVVAGVVLQGLVGFLVGPDLAAFALVALLALVIGRWPRLGSQGSQVVTAAFFAFSTYVAATTTTERFTQLGEIVLLVLIGSAVGVLVNLLLLPPMRYRSAEYGVRALAHELCDLLSDMYPVLHEGPLEEERATQWRDRADRLGTTVGQARTAVYTARESLYYNPRRLLRRQRPHASFVGYESLVDALSRVTHQLESMIRSLGRWSDEDPSERRRDFLHRYGDFLASTARITRLFSELDEDRLRTQVRDLGGYAEEAQSYRDALAQCAEDGALPLTDHSRPYGILLVEATRLLDEFHYACDVLQQSVDRQYAQRPAEH